MKINNLKFLYLILISGFYAHSQTSERYVSEIAPIIDNNDVTYLGETHDIDLHKKFLPELVEYLVDTSIIRSFATEAVLAEHQESLDKYLTDRQALSGSTLEKKYFSEIGKESGWFQMSDTWNLVRKLRDLKLKHGENFKVCGVDVQTLDNGPKRTIELLSRLQALPKALQNEIEKFTSKSLKKISESNGWYDREVYMALNARHCYISGKKMLVHVGSFHAWSVENKFEYGQSWWAMSTYHKWMDPGISIRTIIQGTRLRKNSNPDELTKELLSVALHLNLTDFKIYKTTEFSDSLKMKFKGNPSFGQLGDFWLFGPFGHKVTRHKNLKWF